jgi:hypothetical protein
MHDPCGRIYSETYAPPGSFYTIEGARLSDDLIINMLTCAQIAYMNWTPISIFLLLRAMAIQV